MRFFGHIRDVVRLMQLPAKQRQLTFYSEGKHYWQHLGGLVNELLTTSDIPICYISSGEDDPGLSIEHPNLNTFKIDEGFIRNWLFENIDSKVMVMTMPDLHQYQVKRSKNKVHYVYVQHSLVSLHMAYRNGAFDHFDTIFCAGPHHLREIRAMEARYKLMPKNLVEHGYERLDAIIEEAQKRPKTEAPLNAPKHVLIAPSWGPQGTIESGAGAKITDKLIEKGYIVTLRPHPQTVKFAKNMVDTIVEKHKGNPLFAYDNDVACQNSLHNSDLMISDWSGAALDYAFGLNKPVVFVDVPRKVNNPEYELLDIEPLEAEIRGQLGEVLSLDDINSQNWDCSYLASLESEASYVSNDYVFNIAKSSFKGCLALKEICNAL